MTTPYSNLLSPKEGDRFALDHGEIRIDRVADGQVYLVRWRGSEVSGEPVRMALDVWREAVQSYMTRTP